ncbi:S8 family serine peptidase [Cellulomonas sp. KRMCY2]|uniref:S8 family serine peptidase n=1 Tax=Cellulomonas sp. KRMCY2 TaxID=1304865 RepID=UPI00045E72FF|nr:S8 family serine peptidase [Cellulomonas sp. KRMCY2]
MTAGARGAPGAAPGPIVPVLVACAVLAAGSVLGIAASVASAPAARATTQECSPDVTVLRPEAPPALARLGADAAWRLASGAGVVVAVVDSGVDPANAHLAGAVLPGVDLVGLEGDPTGLTDVAGHGTAIAGQIAARPVVGSGVVGLAPAATILPVRVYYVDDEQSGTAPRNDLVAAGIRYAAEHGAAIINVSISSPIDDAVLRDAVRVATEAGSLIVASAGNRNTTTQTEDSPRYPAAYPEVLAVTAVDDQDQATDDSIHGPHVDVAAPGTNVLTTYFAAGDCLLAADQASASFATAYVSAAAALVAQRFPDESPAQWAHRLEVTAARVSLDARDDMVGWGVVRPSAALAFVDDGSAPGPASPVHPAPPAAGPVAAALEVHADEDLLAPAQAISAWWLLAGVVVCTAAVLVSQLRARRPRPRSPG